MSITFNVARETEHPEFGTVIEAVPGFDRYSVNVSNANAFALLDRLGIEDPDYCGSIEAEDFLGRTMVANVGRPDDGVGSAEFRGEGGCTVIDCGVRPGYFDDRMGSLATLASIALGGGYFVSWA